MTFEDIVSARPADKLKVFIMSWNMGNAPQSGIEYVLSQKEATTEFDIIVFGLQESTYKTKDGVDCVTQLTANIGAILGTSFFKVKHAQRAQMQLFVYAKQDLLPRISNVQFSVENTGFLHVFPNKGGILVTVQVDGTKLAFISCHLTAHEGVKHCEERNASIAEIFGGVRAGDQRWDVAEQFHHVFWMGDMNYRTTFDTTNLPANTKKNIKELNEVALQLEKSGKSAKTSVQQASSSSPKGSKRDSTTSNNNSDSDSDGEEETLMPKSNKDQSEKARKKAEWKEQHKKTMDMVVAEKWEDILALDELNREIAAGRVLNNFTALQPSFPPTFKRTRQESIQRIANGAKGGKEWDLLPEICSDAKRAVSTFYHHKRIPSFTDRILFKSLPAFKSNLVNHFFESCEQAVSSDHKPVRAGFEVTLVKGDDDILVDRNLLRWKGKVSSATSGSRSDAQILRMTFSDMKGENLEEMDSQLTGGKSDPYIVITTDPGALLLYKGTLNGDFEGVRSSIIYHELNPVWKETIDIGLASIDLRGLCRNASLIISVWDYDRTNADDLIGVMSIPIADILAQHAIGSSYSFNQALHSCTEIMGKLSGKITVQGTFDSLMTAYESLHGDRDNTERYVKLSEAMREKASLSQVNCGCTIA
eukprot:CAMPEP_0170390526 /NCGR_PEP_ID=MMETSP0117_2-20130122/19194_1 /TAXON_ID=400756 /ORGANISM="Durinskia baltica, Strain CSIRO CS-38" /LENGTH=646 /DNA_ID=CAMNT_0010646579 /DNA_START=65 /DNA_END=2005 /DNA_ORIENTATION=+